MGFLSEGCRRCGIPFEATAVDTLPLAQALLPHLSKHKLDIVADHLGLPAFHHHRATDDASTVAYMLVPFFKRLEEEHDIHSLGPINRWVAAVSRRSDTYRMLVFLSKVVTSYCRRSAAVAGTPFL